MSDCKHIGGSRAVFTSRSALSGSWAVRPALPTGGLSAGRAAAGGRRDYYGRNLIQARMAGRMLLSIEAGRYG